MLILLMLAVVFPFVEVRLQVNMVATAFIQLVVVVSYFAQSTQIQKKIAGGQTAADEYRFIAQIFVNVDKGRSSTLTGALVRSGNKFAIATSAHAIGHNLEEVIVAAQPFNKHFQRVSGTTQVYVGSSIRSQQSLLNMKSRKMLFPSNFIPIQRKDLGLDHRFDLLFIPISLAEAQAIIRKANGEFLDWSIVPNYEDYRRYHTIMGFGRIGEEVYAERLYYANVEPVTLDHCETDIDKRILWSTYLEQYTMACHQTLMNPNGVHPTTMTGDSGSPVICKVAGRDRVMLVLSGSPADDSYLRNVDSKVLFDYLKLVVRHI